MASGTGSTRIHSGSPPTNSAVDFSDSAVSESNGCSPICVTPEGARQTWLRGIEKVRKRYLTAAMAFKLGRIMRLLIGAGKPRFAQVLAERALFARFDIFAAWLLRLGASEVIGARRDAPKAGLSFASR